MKIPTATTISILGVLAAGGIAFAVNTSVLDTAATTSTYSPAVQAAVVPIANVAAPVAAAGEPVTETSSAAPPTTVAASETTTAYDVAGFGVVLVAQSVDTLSVTAVQPLAGVTYEVEPESPSRIEVEFRAANGQAVEFRAALVSGRIVTSVVNDTESYQASDRDDDHDDDHEDDDHDDHDDDHDVDDHDDDDHDDD